MDYEEILKNQEGVIVCELDGKIKKTLEALTKHLRRHYNGMSIETYLVKFNYVDKDNFLYCQECSNYYKDLGRHLSKKHKMSKEDYIEKYNYDGGFMCETTKEYYETKITKENNPMSKLSKEEREANSPRNYKFYMKHEGLNEEQAKIRCKEVYEKDFEGVLTHTQLEYWIKHFDGDIEKAKDKLSKVQREIRNKK